MGSPEQSLEHLGLIPNGEELAGMGSWTYSPRTQELRWSDNHFRLWGLTPGAIVPTNEWVLAHVHPADRSRAEAALYGLNESDHTTEIEYRVVCDDDLVRHFRVTIAFDEEDEAGDRRLFGTVQDLTSQGSLARHLAAHAAVSKALDEWATFDEGAVGLLAGLGTAMNMPVGVLWVPRSAILVATAVWNAESALLPDVVDAMRDGRPGRGDATLGRAWSERRPILSSDPARGASPRRAAAMRHAGVVATAAIPAVASDEALAILELHSTEPLEPSDRTLRALVGMGHEIGYFLSQRKGQLGEPVLTPREREVLQLAADGVSAATIALRLEVSSATVKRHFEDAYARLGVGDRASAVAAAMRQGFIN